MINKISLIIDHIEKNYHEALSNDLIESITGLSSGHIRNEFKRIVGMPLDKYRRRRQLTLIMEEIINSGISIRENNLLPWSNDNSFRVTFKKEFNLTPKQVMKNYKHLNQLEPKFNYEKFTSEDVIVKDLIQTHGSPSSALKFLLSLPPYGVPYLPYLGGFDEDTLEEICDFLIWVNYREIPKKEYKQKMNELLKYYDLDRTVMVGLKCFYFVNRRLINKFAEYDDIYLSIHPMELNTLWHNDFEFKKVRASNKDKELKDRIVHMPNVLINRELDINSMQEQILRLLIYQDCGAMIYKSFKELRDTICFNLQLDDLLREIHILLLKGVIYIHSSNK